MVTQFPWIRQPKVIRQTGLILGCVFLFCLFVLTSLLLTLGSPMILLLSLWCFGVLFDEIPRILGYTTELFSNYSSCQGVQVAPLVYKKEFKYVKNLFSPLKNDEWLMMFNCLFFQVQYISTDETGIFKELELLKFKGSGDVWWSVVLTKGRRDYQLTPKTPF